MQKMPEWNMIEQVNGYFLHPLLPILPIYKRRQAMYRYIYTYVKRCIVVVQVVEGGLHVLCLI